MTGPSRAELTHGPIDPHRLLSLVGEDAHGATVLFLGVVRDHAGGRRVRAVRYEAYEEMAEEVLAAIALEAVRILGAGRLAVVHRLGELAVGDVSLGIAVSTPHRAEAYDASRYVLEEVKRRLPVWKQERYAEGDAAWVPGEVPPAVPGVGGGR